MTHLPASSSSSGPAAGLGYFLGRYFGLEIDASMASPMAKAPGFVGHRDRAGSASLIVNSGGEHKFSTCWALYALRWGGYSPFFWLNQVSRGDWGANLLRNHVSLRPYEGRVYYAPGDSGTDWKSGGKSPIDFGGSAGLSLFLGGRGHGGEHEPDRPVLPRRSVIRSSPPADSVSRDQRPSRRVFVQGDRLATSWFWVPRAGRHDLQDGI